MSAWLARLLHGHFTTLEGILALDWQKDAEGPEEPRSNSPCSFLSAQCPPAGPLQQVSLQHWINFHGEVLTCRQLPGT